MKILIGVTRDPERIEEYLHQHHGEDGTLTKLGPFVTRLDALNWLTYLKGHIGNFQEIIPASQSGGTDVWYGFTFEQPTRRK